MRLFRANDDTVRFAIAAQGIAANTAGRRYSIWLTREDGAPRLLGDVRDAVGEDGQLTAAGPGNDDADEFLDWLADLRRESRSRSTTKAPRNPARSSSAATCRLRPAAASPPAACRGS